jgi:hypothetical protein
MNSVCLYAKFNVEKFPLSVLEAGIDFLETSSARGITIVFFLSNSSIIFLISDSTTNFEHSFSLLCPFELFGNKLLMSSFLDTSFTSVIICKGLEKSTCLCLKFILFISTY